MNEAASEQGHPTICATSSGLPNPGSVDADAACGVIKRSNLGQPEDGVLGGDISSHARDATQAGRRGPWMELDRAG
jgi:hypothetical protein